MNRRAKSPDRPQSGSADSTKLEPPAGAAGAFMLTLAGSALLFLAMPPVDWGPLGVLAPVPWLVLVARPRPLARREYIAVWSGSVSFWLALLHWMPYPFPAIYAGWLAISFYLSLYLPLFVSLARLGVHRCRLNIVVVAPVVWVGLELVRAHLLSGFTFGTLGHTLYRTPALIQVADLGGAYAVSFVMMLVAACLTVALGVVPESSSPSNPSHPWRRIGPIVVAAVVLAVTWAYGAWRLRAIDVEAQQPPLLRAALIQGSIDINVKADPAAQERIYQDHLRLSLEAVDRHDNLDLVIWPETMYRAPLILIDDDARLPEGTPGSVEIARQNGEVALQGLADLERAVGVPMLIGLDVIQVGDGVIDNFNSAVLVQVDGGLAARYDKMHPVMFGEYIPLGSTFPLLYELTAGALPRGIRAGERLEAFEVAGARLAVNICYETTVPHLLRRQVRAMGAAGAEPDVLVNLTNDGWFYGASELDLHLISGLFRAVELRKPLLIAANTGFSAWVDGGGRLRAQGGRRVEDIVLAEPRRCELTSWYTRWGDTPAGLCLAACAALVIVAVRDRRRYRTVQ